MANTKSSENAFLEKITELQQLTAEVIAKGYPVPLEQQLNIIELLNQLKDNDIFPFHYNKQFSNLCPNFLRAIEILMNSRSSHKLMIRNEACKILIYIIRKSLFYDYNADVRDSQYQWQKKLYVEFYKRIANLINDLVVENDPLCISITYPLVVYTIEVIGVHILIEREFFNNYLYYIFCYASTHQPENYKIVPKIVRIILNNVWTYNKILLEKNCVLVTLKNLRMAVTKWHRLIDKTTTRSEIELITDYIKITFEFTRFNQNDMKLKAQIMTHFLAVYIFLYERLRSCDDNNAKELLLECLDHFNKNMNQIYQIKYGMSSIFDVMIQVSMRIMDLMFTSRDQTALFFKIFNKAIEIIANIAIGLDDEEDIYRFKNEYWFDKDCSKLSIRFYWSSVFDTENHENCSFKIIDFFCKKYKPEYSREIHWFFEDFDDLFEEEIKRTKTIMVPETLNSLRNLFKINKEYDIVPMDDCCKIFEMQLNVIIHFDLSNFIKTAVKFYGELLNEYPEKNDYFLDKRNNWIDHLNKVIEKFDVDKITEDEKSEIKSNSNDVKYLIAGMKKYFGENDLNENSRLILDDVTLLFNNKKMKIEIE